MVPKVQTHPSFTQFRKADKFVSGNFMSFTQICFSSVLDLFVLWCWKLLVFVTWFGKQHAFPEVNSDRIMRSPCVFAFCRICSFWSGMGDPLRLRIAPHSAPVGCPRTKHDCREDSDVHPASGVRQFYSKQILDCGCVCQEILSLHVSACSIGAKNQTLSRKILSCKK